MRTVCGAKWPWKKHKSTKEHTAERGMHVSSKIAPSRDDGASPTDDARAWLPLFPPRRSPFLGTHTHTPRTFPATTQQCASE